jgi:hypothetical protein
MAKQSGLGDQLFIGGFDIGADTSAIGNLSTPRATLPSTGITASANERIFGERDGMAEFTTYFNPGPVGGPLDNEHKALRTLPLTDTQVMYLRGAGIGNDAFAMTAKQINYDPTRGDDGSFTFNVSAEANAFGADWALQLTAGKRSDTTATNGAGLDTTASLAFGFQAYLQVFSFTGTSVTIQLQDSADNVSFANLTDGQFTVVSAAPTFERIQSSSATATVRRYLRVITSGTFSQCTFAVAINKNDAARAL